MNVYKVRGNISWYLSNLGIARCIYLIGPNHPYNSYTLAALSYFHEVPTLFIGREDKYIEVGEDYV